MTVLTQIPPRFDEQVILTSTRTKDDSSHSPLANNAQNWTGRAVISLKDETASVANCLKFSAILVAHAAHAVVSNMFLGFGLIFADSSAEANFFRKIEGPIIRMVEYLANIPGGLQKCSEILRHNVAFIDLVIMLADINYLWKTLIRTNTDDKKIEPKDNNLVIGGRIAFLTANIGGALMWLEEMSFLSLAKTAHTIGEARIFSVVPQVISKVPFVRDLPRLQKFANLVGELRVFSFVKSLSCLSVTLRALDLGYALFALDASRRLMTANNTSQITAAGIELTSYLSELALSAAIFAGVTNVVALGVGASACVALAASAFLYRVTHENELKQKAPVVVLAQVV